MIEETLLRIAVALEKLVELRAAPLVMATVNDALEKTAEDAPVRNCNAHVDSAPGESALIEPPKKKRGRPTKEEAAAKAAAAVEEPATALPVEQPKCPDCGTVLTPENSSVSSVSKKLHHVGCTIQEARDANAPTAEQPKPVELKIEKVREAALAFTKAREAAAPGSGRQAFIDVLGSMGAKTLADVPQPRWAELVQKLEVR